MTSLEVNVTDGAPSPIAMGKVFIAEAVLLVQKNRAEHLLVVVFGLVSVFVMASAGPVGAISHEIVSTGLYEWIIVLSFLWPAVVWSKESERSREYFRSLPVPVPRHTVARVAVGGASLLLAYGVGLGAGLGVLMFSGTGLEVGSVLVIAAIVAVSITTYCWGSIAAVSSTHALRWQTAALLVLAAAPVVGQMIVHRVEDLQLFGRLLYSIAWGKFGIATVLTVPEQMVSDVVQTEWRLGAVSAWLCLAVLGVAITAYLDRRRAQIR